MSSAPSPLLHTLHTQHSVPDFPQSPRGTDLVLEALAMAGECQFQGVALQG